MSQCPSIEEVSVKTYRVVPIDSFGRKFHDLYRNLFPIFSSLLGSSNDRSNQRTTLCNCPFLSRVGSSSSFKSRFVRFGRDVSRRSGRSRRSDAFTIETTGRGMVTLACGVGSAALVFDVLFGHSGVGFGVGFAGVSVMRIRRLPCWH